MTDLEFHRAVLERLDAAENQNRALFEAVEKFGASAIANTEVIDLHNQVLAALNNHVSEIKNRLDRIDKRLDGIENDVRTIKIVLQVDEQVANLRRIGITDVLARS